MDKKNDYRIVKIKGTNIVGIAEIKPTWWQRLLQLKVYVLIPQIKDNYFCIDFEYIYFFSLAQPNYSEPFVQDLSKVENLIIQSKEIKDRIEFKEVEIENWEIKFSNAISRGANCYEWQESIKQMKKEVSQLKELINSLAHLIFSVIGDSLRAKATEEFKQQTDELTYDRSNTAELINDIDCHIQAYKTLFEQNTLAQSSCETAEIIGRNATELIQ